MYFLAAASLIEASSSRRERRFITMRGGDRGTRTAHSLETLQTPTEHSSLTWATANNGAQLTHLSECKQRSTAHSLERMQTTEHNSLTRATANNGAQLTHFKDHKHQAQLTRVRLLLERPHHSSVSKTLLIIWNKYPCHYRYDKKDYMYSQLVLQPLYFKEQILLFEYLFFLWDS